MPPKFTGSLEQLASIVETAGLTGTWSEQTGFLQYKTSDRGVMNWFRTGTIQFQGPAGARKRLEDALTSALEGATVGPVSRPARHSSSIPPHLPSTPPVQTGRRIFLVHGHDKDACDQLELALHRLQLDPFILQNSSGGNGLTLIEALENHIGHDYTSDFGIVLLTPDDMGYSVRETAAEAEPRARQNVILEAGMLLASLTRERVALIVKGHVQLPSDLEGIIRYPYNLHIREILPKLVARLQNAGIHVDQGLLAKCD